MPRPCTVCTHPNRPEIDAALVNGDAYRDIACMHDIGRMALSRHRAHIGAALVQAAERQEEAGDALADDLLAQARPVNRDLRRMLEDVKAARSLPACLQMVDRLQKQLVLQGAMLEREGGAVDPVVEYRWRRG